MRSGFGAAPGRGPAWAVGAWVAAGRRAAYVTDGHLRDSVHFAAGAGNLPRGGVATGAGGTAGAVVFFGLTWLFYPAAAMQFVAKLRARLRHA